MNSIFKITPCLALLLIVSCNTLRPFILSESDEIEMGEKFKQQIIADQQNYPPYKGSPIVSEYIDSLGTYISKVQKDWKNPDLNFTFTVIQDDTMINAFAVPGGHVFVYTGLLLAATNEAQVAGVLAHEIGHVTKHHSANMLVKQNMINLVNDILFGSDSSSVLAITTLLEGLTFLRFSRDNEYEADSCAVAYTSLARMNPTGLSQFLGILKEKYGDQGRILETVENVSSSHPPLSERCKHVQSIIGKTPGADISIDCNESKYAQIKGLLK